MTIAFYDAAQVERLLDYPGCIAAIRAAMQALSLSDETQPLRQILKIEDETLFGVMPGGLRAIDGFGAKLVSVTEHPARSGRSRHRGVVVLFSVKHGDIECIADAEVVTGIRTACATAAATDALARADAAVLTVFGTGAQAAAHVRALCNVRHFERVVIWGRSLDTAAALAEKLAVETGLVIEALPDGQRAAGEADVICTVSGSTEPILLGEWVRKGTHVNLVGSSYLGPVEVDSALVASARYIADYRPGVLAQASELAVARQAGLVSDTHVAGEIGQVFAGTIAGREHADQITIYKSLGHVVQDLAATAYLHRRARSDQPDVHQGNGA